MIGAYTVWTYPSGLQAPLFMPEVDILDVRNKYSKSYQKEDSAWQKRPGEMYKKTVIKNHSKLQPCSIEMEKAVYLDNLHETGQSQLGAFDFEGALLTQGDEQPIEFDINSFGHGPDVVSRFLEICANSANMSIEEMKVQIASTPDEIEHFKSALDKWVKKQSAKGQGSSTKQGEGETQTLPKNIGWLSKARPTFLESLTSGGIVLTVRDHIQVKVRLLSLGLLKFGQDESRLVFLRDDQDNGSFH